MREPLIAFIAPSSVVPAYEFELGLDRLRKSGLRFRVSAQCKKRHLFFAGTDQERAHALVEAAMDPEVDVVWCARGGYGAYRLLPILDQMLSKEHRRPSRKLFVGYSDATFLFDYVKTKWGWSVLHAPMPGLRNFLEIQPSEYKNLLSWIQGVQPSAPWGAKKLKFLGKPPETPIEGELVGGNFTDFVSLLPTPYRTQTRDRILFLEDVGESLSRLDRLIHQFAMAGGFEGIQAVVLGDFKDCEDPVSSVMKKPPLGTRSKPKLEPVRPSITQIRYFKEVWGSFSECYGFPVAMGLPVGHGPGKQSLPLWGRYRLHPQGRLELLSWPGLKG